jgi:RNA polymerase sigma-70 factor, ECF subfamily
MADNPSPRYSSLSLQEVVCLCAGPCDNAAWEEFVARVGKSISLTILRTAFIWGEPSRSVVEDLVQATYLKLWEDSCRLLRDFAMQNPDGILGYLKKVAANTAHDHFRHGRSQSAGGSQTHVSTTDVDVEAGKEVHGSQDKIAFQILLNQIDEYLNAQLTGPDQQRDRTIFWLYFRQGMSTKEIGSLPTIGLSPKGVGSVIERLKRCMRERITGGSSQPDDDAVEAKSKNAQEYEIGLYGSPEYGTSIR